MSHGSTYKDQKVIIEGSRSGALVFRTKLSYDSSNNLQYIGESKTDNATDIPQWYIEKLEYDASNNLIDVKVASNQLYSGTGTIDVDTVSEAPNIKLTITTADYSLVEEGDILQLTTVTNGSLIQGKVISRSNNEIILDIEGKTGIVDESGTSLGATDLLYTLNNVNSKDFNQKVWDFRDRYIYK